MFYGRLLAMRFFHSANVLGVILTLYYRAHGLNYTEILSLEIALSVSMAAATVPLGVWADRHGRVRALKAGNLLFVAGALVFLVSSSYWQFLCSDLLYGLGLAWQSGADTALLAPGGSRWFARYEAAAAAAGIVSSLVAGVVLQAYGMRPLVVLNAAAAILAALAVLTLRNDAPAAATSAAPVALTARSGWRAVAQAPWLLAWTVAGAVMFRLVGINLMFLDLPLWVRSGWHGVYLGFGVTVLYAAGWGALLAPRVQARLGPRGALVLAQLAAAPLVMVLAITRTPWILTAAMAAALMLQSWQSPIVKSVVTDAIPEPVRVTALSVLDLPSLVVTVVAEIGVGLLADVHLAWALLASGAAVAMAVPLWWFGPRRAAPPGAEGYTPSADAAPARPA